VSVAAIGTSQSGKCEPLMRALRYIIARDGDLLAEVLTLRQSL
jgi:hypothetical protein